jgi:hypothetical protein
MRRVSLTAGLCLFVLVAGAAAAQAHPRVVREHAVRVTYASSLRRLHRVAAAADVGSRARLVRLLTPRGAKPGNGAGAQGSAGADTTIDGGQSGAGVLEGFNGLSDLDSDNLNGFPLTPPDQGLCVGPDPTLRGHPNAVFEPINEAVRETTPSGALLRPDESLATLFADPNAEGDVRCLYDPSTRSFYFTDIGYPDAGPNNPTAPTNTEVDVAVLNARGLATYRFDTSLGGQFFGDQPKTGFDNNALVVSTDEYYGDQLQYEAGAIVVAISKSQLVAERPVVNDAVLGPVSLASDPVVGLDPAIDTGSGNEYFLNSVPFLPDGSNNPVGNTLGLWTLRNDSSVTSGHGTPTLSSTVLRVNPYAFPVLAPSTGDGSEYTYTGFVITSEPALNPDDSRISGPVNVTTSPGGGVELWTALDAAVTKSTDGAEWFAIDAIKQRVDNQGYVSTRGASLLYPAVEATSSGPAAMVFTITSPRINPAAAWTRLGSGKVSIAAAGSGPHWSFSDAPPFNTPRWGDYSFAVTDPVSGNFWLGTEYIPPKPSWDPSDNWGTYVFEVAP